MMREQPRIIKAINALRYAGCSFESIDRIPYLREGMADELVELGYAEKQVSEKLGSPPAYRLTAAAYEALKAKPAERKILKTLPARLSTLPPRLK
jgi:hypothetical protein